MISLPIWVFVVLIVLASLPLVGFIYVLIISIISTIWERKVIKAQQKYLEEQKEKEKK